MLISLPAVADEEVVEEKVAPHQQQAKLPRHQVDVPISQNVTEVVAASIMDLNVIYTPFKQVSIVQNAGQQFEIIDGALYFQPTDTGTFSVFLSEADDPNSPVYQLTIAPSPVPIGQKINLTPTDNYVPPVSKEEALVQSEPRKVGAERHIITDNFTFRDEVVAMLSAASTYVAEPRGKNVPQNFILADDKAFAPYFIGNVLMDSVYHFASPFYEIFVLQATNRSNHTIQLTSADFAKLAPRSGEMSHKYLDEMALGVAFYPQKVLQPQQSTSVLLLRRVPTL